MTRFALGVVTALAAVAVVGVLGYQSLERQLRGAWGR